MDDWGAMTVVWSGGLLVLLLVVAFSRRARRHGGALRSGVIGAMWDWQNRDKQKALEIIVEGKAAATEPEHADGNLPELESPEGEAPHGPPVSVARPPGPSKSPSSRRGT